MYVGDVGNLSSLRITESRVVYSIVFRSTVVSVFLPGGYSHIGNIDVLTVLHARMPGGPEHVILDSLTSAAHINNMSHNMHTPDAHD